MPKSLLHTARLGPVLLGVLLASLTACAGTPHAVPTTSTGAPAPAAMGGIVGAPAPAGSSLPPQVNSQCKVDSDCVVKNVGNCCGYYPACVNRDSPVDPAAVQAECKRRGLVSACNVPHIQACRCVAQHCEAVSAAQTAFGPG